VGRSRLKFWLPFLTLLLIVATGPFLWMPALGSALVRSEAPAKADIAVVLAGDWYGNRILYAADLVRQGYLPAVLVSGPAYYDIHECDVAIQFAVRKGCPADWFIPLPNPGLSTREESRHVLGELQRRGVRSFVLVTSDYHTARSARIYRDTMRKMGFAPDMRVVAAPDRWFRADGWWKTREGLKTVFFECSKTVATALGM
jgi:uncharacterized SAM-binding protein YcdF (DUF218 family)